LSFTTCEATTKSAVPESEVFAVAEARSAVSAIDHTTAPYLCTIAAVQKPVQIASRKPGKLPGGLVGSRGH